MKNESEKPSEENAEYVRSEASMKYAAKHHQHGHSHDRNDWAIGKYFWGLSFILLGGLFLASNFGLINIEWSNLWRLWPLFIVATGLSILSARNIIWRIFSIIITTLIFAAIVWTLVWYSPSVNVVHTNEAVVQQISSVIKQAEVSIKAGAGSINVNTADQSVIAKTKLESNVTDLTEQSNIIGDKQMINLSMGDNNNWWSGNVKNSLTVNLTRTLPLTLNVDAGASTTNIDMSQAQLLATNINLGASSLMLRLGDKQAMTAVDIESGASSITVQIPASSGVQLRIDGGLSSNHLADLVKVDKNTYESANYQTSTKKINITSSIGVSSFTIERY